MSIGLFLDVDITLTTGFIQRSVAAELGALDAYFALEAEFQVGKIFSAEFGKSLISLFNDAGFEKLDLERLQEIVPLNPWTKHVLSIPVTKYLVSSGPSYYIRPFAARFGIPDTNIICSEYVLSPSGSLVECRAIAAVHKKEFVTQKKGEHLITVGVGDHPAHDGPFVTECDVPILTVPAPGYLFLDDLSALSSMMSRMASHHPQRTHTKITVFIGSSGEQERAAENLNVQLSRSGYHTQLWRDGTFVPTRTSIESLESALSAFDFAVILLTPDDTTTSRGKTLFSPRDNLIFELGLYMGHLGRSRCIIVYPRGMDVKMPSDLAGVNRIDYDFDLSKSDVQSAMSPVATQIKEHISTIGQRSDILR